MHLDSLSHTLCPVSWRKRVLSGHSGEVLKSAFGSSFEQNDFHIGFNEVTTMAQWGQTEGPES